MLSAGFLCAITIAHFFNSRSPMSAAALSNIGLYRTTWRVSENDRATLDLIDRIPEEASVTSPLRARCTLSRRQIVHDTIALSNPRIHLADADWERISGYEDDYVLVDVMDDEPYITRSQKRELVRRLAGSPQYAFVGQENGLFLFRRSESSPERTGRWFRVARPSAQYPARVAWREGLRLVGFDIHPESRFNELWLCITLHLQALRDMGDDYHFFLKLRGEQRELLFLIHPCSDLAPTSTWIPGEFYESVSFMPIAANALRSTYEMYLQLVRLPEESAMEQGAIEIEELSYEQPIGQIDIRRLLSGKRPGRTIGLERHIHLARR